MDVIEIGLALMLVTLIIAGWWLSSLISKLKDLNAELIDLRKKVNCQVYPALDTLFNTVGWYSNFYESREDYSTKPYPISRPSSTVNDRVNLLMDHLNLEIKEGAPSKTTLVKKKLIKKSK